MSEFYERFVILDSNKERNTISTKVPVCKYINIEWNFCHKLNHLRSRDNTREKKGGSYRKSKKPW